MQDKYKLTREQNIFIAKRNIYMSDVNISLYLYLKIL